MEGVSIMAHAQQYSDEDKTMQIICYVLCGLSVAILLGLLLYTMLP
jgi:high-affinity Fe2+/Pb2+ permease